MGARDESKYRLAATVLRASYIILFFGFSLSMMLLSVAQGSKWSVIAFLVMYVLAVGWQVFTVALNARRVVPWLMLLMYVGVFGIPLAGAWLSK